MRFIKHLLIVFLLFSTTAFATMPSPEEIRPYITADVLLAMARTPTRTMPIEELGISYQMKEGEFVQNHYHGHIFKCHFSLSPDTAGQILTDQHLYYMIKSNSFPPVAAENSDTKYHYTIEMLDLRVGDFVVAIHLTVTKWPNVPMTTCKDFVLHPRKYR